MQKPNSKDLLRAGGWSIGTAGLLFAVALTVKVPLQQLLTPMAIGILIALGLAVSLVDLVIVLRNPERLAIARGEKLPSPEQVQKLQRQTSGALNIVASAMAVLAGIFLVILLAIFWR